MGKYMRKAKVSGEVAVMEVSHQSTLGVRTRARALAALQKPAPDSSLAYLELRSRRLEKPLPPSPAASKQSKDAAGPSPKKAGGGGVRANSGAAGSVSLRRRPQDEEAALDAEASFGENVLESETRERFSRETTPCSLIRDSEITVTPGSTTKSTKSLTGARRMQSAMHQNIPTTLEMEEFFSAAEQLQQRIFIEKYNFDPVSDGPLPGRFEWVELDF